MTTPYRIVLALVVFAGLNSLPAAARAQGWLLGERQGPATQVKVSGKYRKGNAVRVDAHGGPFDGRAVGQAVLVRLAEMSRDKGMAHFRVVKESCWQSMPNYVPGPNYCWAIATMFTGDQAAPQPGEPAAVRVEDVLATRN